MESSGSPERLQQESETGFIFTASKHDRNGVVKFFTGQSARSNYKIVSMSTILNKLIYHRISVCHTNLASQITIDLFNCLWGVE